MATSVVYERNQEAKKGKTDCCFVSLLLLNLPVHDASAKLLSPR